jgi:hypothetical protein
LDLLTALVGAPETRADPLLNDPYFWYQGYPMFGLNQTMTADREIVPDSFEGYVQHAYKSSGPVFSCELVRLSVFSEARFMYRRINDGVPGDMFSTDALGLLRAPWPGGTTGDLLSKALTHADFAGNAFILRDKNRLKLLRPDWVDIVIGVDSPTPDVDAVDDPDGRVIGYLYHPGGRRSQAEPIAYTASQVAHFAPLPDPLASYKGMSWLTPVVREVAGDKQATAHKNKFYEQGATPNMVITGQWTDPEVLRKWTQLFRDQHEGEANAYKSLILGSGMDATVVGKDFQQLDFKAVQGASETRIAAASGVGAVIAQLSEGLQGSSLNAGNYQAARRRVADVLFRPLWRQFCGSLEQIIPTPPNAELWYDDRDISFLQEDQRDAADIEQVKSTTIRNLLDGGFEPQSVVDAVTSEDMRMLSHTGKVSVQLQDPNADDPVEGMTPSEAAERGLPEDFAARFNAVGLLIRSGFKPEAALEAVELDPIEHFDLLPVTVQSAANVLDDPPDPTKAAASDELTPDQEPTDD